MRGRVPRPREERIRAGSTRNLPEPMLVAGRAEVGELLEPPMPLGKTARAWWDAVTPQLQGAGLLERIDLYVLACAASAWGDVVKAQAVLDEFGYFQAGSQGQVVPHAATKIKRDAMMTFERFVNHLALSPVARARLGLAHLHGRALMQEMEAAIGPDGDTIDAEVVGDEDVEAVGLPGV